MGKLPIIGVMGSGEEPYLSLAQPLGRFIAQSGCHLLCGGGKGVMEAVCRAFVAEPHRRGLAIGIIPAASRHDPKLEPKSGYPNDAVELVIQTHLDGHGGPEHISSRNWINILSSHAIVALPGSFGTLAEIRIANGLGKPLLLFHPPGNEQDWWPEPVTGVAGTSDWQSVCRFVRKFAV